MLRKNHRGSIPLSDSFLASDLIIQRNQHPAKKPKTFDDIKFGAVFSDHMLEIDWSLDNGWEKPVIKPFQNLSLHPASSCLHYAIELYEGMKAYRTPGGKVQMFRPDRNMARMQATAARSSLPAFDADEMLKCITSLVNVDRDWIPDAENASLYIRPTMIGTHRSLGLASPTHGKAFVFTCPVGPYFSTGGFNPISLKADPGNVRAAVGGVGNFKMGCNYAPTVLATGQAIEQGHQQVLWLYGPEHYITEVGTMNIMLFWRNTDGDLELVTPPIEQGIILPGVTRESLLQLAREWGEFKVSERPITMGELVTAVDQNRVLEMFGAGTASVVCPVNRVEYNGRLLTIPTDGGLPLATRFLTTLSDIQYGVVNRPDWQYTL